MHRWQITRQTTTSFSMENRGYTLIQDWMLDLPLSLVETTIYAVVYGFSQDGESTFSGSLAYMARKCKSSKDTARRGLRRLEELGYIDRIEVPVNGVTFNSYKVCKERLDLQGGVANCKEGGGKLLPNNKEYNKDNICVSNKGSRSFNPPTHAEVSAYCRERMNAVNVDAFMSFYESNGWMVGKNRMKDWRAAVRTWEQREQRQPQGRPTPARKESNRERLDRIAQEMFGGFNYGCEEQ